MKEVIKYRLILSLVLFLSFSCSKESSEIITEEGGERVVSRVSAGVRRVRIEICKTYTLETKTLNINDIISNYNVLVYDSSGEKRFHCYSANSGNIDIDVPMGEITVAVIANSGEIDKSNYTKIDSLWSAKTATMHSQTNGVLFTGFANVNITESQNSVSILLKRVIAKVTVLFNRDQLNEAISLEITKIQLKNAPLSVKLFGNNSPGLSQIVTDGDYITTNLEPLNHESASAIYLFENMQGDIGSNSIPSLKYAGNKSNICSYLEITANYTSPAKTGVIKYRSFLGENTTNNFDVVRETHYKETILFTGSAINESSWRVDVSNLTNVSYLISTSASPEIGGVVYGAGYYYHGDLPCLLAVPNPNYLFTGWSPIISAVTCNKNYTANFLYDPPQIAVTGITISPSSLTLYKDDVHLVAAQVLPWDASVKDIIWSSGNNSVAQIDATGIVTAVNAGYGSIVATTLQGGYSATCYITVLERVFNLNLTSITLRYGESLSIGFETSPTTTPVWSSDNSSVAYVTSAGVVTAGNITSVTTIRATANGINRSCIVNVVAPVVPVSGVSLDRSAATLLSSGAKTTLIASILPSNATNKTVIWSSSNSSVATVLEGVITSVNPGNCIITVTTSDGGHSATCNLTVESPNIPVTTISLNHTSLKLDKGESGQLSANIYPLNATDKSIEWISSDESVASVDINSGLIVAKEFGVTVITAKNVLSGVTAQ
ncbi:MAG: hypothetical protein CVU13_01630 [Bacteroidetes bacterium HGW-Bacteroidetes-8]|jgi:uncharacterized protein YjdB|nr:MAG: hypothetical protein CVU13_01630 [Bacteroidetes bacterium HGW-Bacteroidetes-8]